MNFTNALLVCLVMLQLPDGAIRTAWAAMAAYMLLHVGIRTAWRRLVDYQTHRSTFGNFNASNR